MKRVVTLFAVCAAIGIAWFVYHKQSVHELRIKTYFASTENLKPGNAVWVDGVQVGTVTAIQLVPSRLDHPIEVSMKITTPYMLSIPEDSVVEVTAQGVLGPEIVNINTRGTTGAPVINGSVLSSRETTSAEQTADALERVGNALIEESKSIRAKNKKDSGTPSAH